METRTADGDALDIWRTRWLLCPTHGPLVAELCEEPEENASSDESAPLPTTARTV